MAQITYREALNQALREELDRDERVFIMGEEVGYFGGAFKVTDGLLAVYGEKRIRDTPISELTIVGAGVGPIHELRAHRAQHCEIGAFLVR